MQEQKNNSSLLDKLNPKSIMGVLAVVLIGGSVFYHYMEGWSWIDSIYFCVVTLATVGYGDLTPQTDIGKLVTVFYILIGVGILASGLSYLIRYVAVKHLQKRATEKDSSRKE